MSAGADAVPRWVRVLVWSLAISLGVVGIVVALVSSSLWPLIAFLGLAAPMMPLGTFQHRRARMLSPQDGARE